uniref:Uncharacterized protein n=1 Tax=Astyanax mexicanus TaxID=7994 RepID=A0A3B1KKM0_ASTMX
MFFNNVYISVLSPVRPTYLSFPCPHCCYCCRWSETGQCGETEGGKGGMTERKRERSSERILVSSQPRAHMESVLSLPQDDHVMCYMLI